MSVVPVSFMVVTPPSPVYAPHPQAAAKALKKLLKKQAKAKKAAEAAEASPTPGRPRTRSMDLADATNGRRRTRSMDLAEGKPPATAADTPKKKKKTKRSAEDGGEVAPKKSKIVDANGDVAAVAAAATLSSGDFCATHKIFVKADDDNFKAPVPMTTFESTPFGGPIRAALDAAGYPAPTPTQAQSWPIALGGRDIISVARTGSGKTLGFLLPAFHAMLNRPGGMKPRMGQGPYIVVLAPTRELACQINEEATKFGRTSGIRSTTVYGKSQVVPRCRIRVTQQCNTAVLLVAVSRYSAVLAVGTCRVYVGVSTCILDVVTRCWCCAYG